MEKQTFDVIGMTCAACQANVTKAVSKLAGVKSVDVSLISNTMKVEYDPSKVDAQRIMNAVDGIGYEAVKQGQILDEASEGIEQQWDARQKRIQQEISEKKTSLYVSLVLLAVLMCFSMLPMLGIFTILMDMEWMMVSSIIQLILCTFILFFQRSFFSHGLKALIKKAPNMDSLVAIGSGASYLYGIYGILQMAYGYGIMDHALIHSSMDALYFESAAMILTLVSLGKYLEARSKAKTGDALGKLVSLAPKTAVVERDGVEIQVQAADVHTGDLVVIRPGQRIPVDGIVANGIGYVDQAAITGESIPVEKQTGDEVISATININGTFKFTATKVGSDTTLAQIIRLVDEAGNSKAPIARLADQVAGIFVPVVFGIALMTIAGWLVFGYNFAFAFNAGISVLVISCPCALGLATPLAIMVSTGKAAENGILVKSAASLETLHKINTVVLDKTGTITSGKPEVTDIRVFDPEYDDNSFLQLAANVEMGSEHPLGKAVVEKAKEENIPLAAPDAFEAIGGRGLRAKIGNQTIIAGNAALMQDEKIDFDKQVSQAVDAFAAKGQTPLLFACDGKVIGIVSVADTIRPTSAQALRLLKDMHIEVVMLTGDNEKTARAIAALLPIDRVISDVLPAQKESVVRSLQQEGKQVVMVGDGINDAPALMRADVGMAIGAGTDIALESADIVLMKDNLLDVVTAIDLSRKTITNIKENLFWAFFYNCLGIPVAMGLFYPIFGWLLNPMIGAAAMSLSSVTVCMNALRLRFFKPRNETKAQVESQKEAHSEVIKEEQKIENTNKILEQQAEAEEQNSILLHIEGMSCQHCVLRVQKALEEVDGVLSAQVSLDPPLAMVLKKPSVKDDELMEAIHKAGYQASLASRNTGEYSYSVGVEGMSCAHCQNRVMQALQKLDGVTSVYVSLENGKADITASSPLTLEQVRKSIEEAGYIPADSFLSENEYTENNKTEKEEKAVKKTMTIEGMSCSHCKQAVITALSKVDGVNLVDVDLPSGQAQIETVKPVDDAALIQAVEDAGYTVKEIK